MRYSRRKGFVPTPFHAKFKQSLVNFFYEYNIAMPGYRADKWRMVNPEIDQVKGQPHLGEVMIRATDGVHALVEEIWEKENVGLIQIHLTNFLGKVRPQGYTPKISMVAKPTKTTTVERRTKKTKPKNKKPKTKSEFSKMFDEMFK